MWGDQFSFLDIIFFSKIIIQRKVSTHIAYHRPGAYWSINNMGTSPMHPISLKARKGILCSLLLYIYMFPCMKEFYLFIYMWSCMKELYLYTYMWSCMKELYLYTYMYEKAFRYMVVCYI